MITRKICLLGAFSVGKTSLVRRFVHEVYDDRYVTTLGVKIETKLVTRAEEEVKFIIWDMEGAEDLGAGAELVTPRMRAYLQGASGVLLVADGTRPATLDIALRLHDWLLRESGGIQSLLLLNKADLTEEWQIGDEQLDALPETLQRFTTSALSGDNVERTFERFAKILSRGE